MQRDNEKLAVLLVSVDPEYFEASDAYLARAKKILQKHKIDWPTVFLPGGWNDVMHLFNLSLYSNIVVDGKGIVRGVHVHGKELEGLVGSLKEDGKPGKSPP